jgi:hypothetical protein
MITVLRRVFVVSPGMVLVCALELLGRSAAALPPIELVAVPPPGIAANVEAFVRAGSGVISLLTTTETFAEVRRSECRAYNAVAKVASIITHEEWHVLHGSDERGAYEVQLATLMRLGVSLTSRVFDGVVRSMQVVLESQHRVTH